jgi:hypothetical protein
LAKSSSPPHPSPKKSPSSSPKPLPPPVPVASQQKNAGAVEPEKPAGFLNGLFNSPSSASSPTTPLEMGSSALPNGSPAEPLSPEAEALLASIPESIGPEEPGAAAAPEQAADTSDGEALLEMVGEQLLDDEDMRALLELVGEQLAKWREHEPYRRAGERAGSIASKPWAQVINHLWITYAPALLTDLTAHIPGLGKALLMTSIAFGPTVVSDLARSKEKRAAGGRPGETPERPAPPTIDGSRLRPGRQSGSVRETE